MSFDVALREHIASYLAGELHLLEFEDWFYAAMWGIDSESDAVLIQMVYAIKLLLAEYTNKDRTEDEVRFRLRAMLERGVIGEWDRAVELHRKRAGREEGMSKEFRVEGSSFEWSLLKLTGKRIMDIFGYPSDPFGDGPCFVVTRIVFEDGTSVHLEGDRNTVSISSCDELKNMDADMLEWFILEREEQGNE